MPIARSRRRRQGAARVAELAAAFAPSKERHLETTAQGNAFIEASGRPGLAPRLTGSRRSGLGQWPIRWRSRLPPPATALPLEPALAAYLQAVAANWVSAGVRLIPLGQTDGQRVLAALEPIVATAAQHALKTPLDDIGSAAFRADLASARHETQYTRLFRS